MAYTSLPSDKVYYVTFSEVVMNVGDKVKCTARWVCGWYGVIIEMSSNIAKVKWEDRTAGECWVELNYLQPLTGDAR